MIIFVSIALAGFVLVAGMFLFGHDHDAGDSGGHDVGHDVGGDGHPESEGTISIFSTRVIGTFIMGFGAAGAIASYYKVGYTGSSFIGIATGCALGAIMYGILTVFLREQASSLVSTESLVGCIGTVNTSIDKGGRGEVGVSASGQYRNFPARAAGPVSIEKGQQVRVVRVTGGELIVEQVEG